MEVTWTPDGELEAEKFYIGILTALLVLYIIWQVCKFAAVCSTSSEVGSTFSEDSDATPTKSRGSDVDAESLSDVDSGRHELVD